MMTIYWPYGGHITIHDDYGSDTPRVVDFLNGAEMIHFAMRPRYGKKSILCKRSWVYIAGMRSFGPLKTIFR